MKLVTCARAITGGVERRDFAFAIESERICAVGDAQSLIDQFSGAQRLSFGRDVIITPGFINGHSHAYQILLRGWADDRTFEAWRSDALYRIVPLLSPEDVYTTFRIAFDEMLSAGITTVAEFFYLNGAGNAHAQAAIEAAKDAGIRLVFARTWMDANYAPEAFREDIHTARARTLDLMQWNTSANVDICIAPHSLHAASPDMLRAAAAFAREHGCMLHVHVAEAQYEGAQTLERFGHTPVQLLETLGVLDERTVAIHAIYITEEEQRLLAARGARVVHNPMTNQYLGDGICDVTGLQTAGVTMGLGTDADVKPSIIEEMRAASMLQKIARLDGSALSAAQSFDLGTAQGARALRVNAGDLAAGMFADFMAIDAAAMDAWSPPINALVYRGENAWVRETWVGGNRVRERNADGLRAERSQMAAILERLQRTQPSNT